MISDWENEGGAVIAPQRRRSMAAHFETLRYKSFVESDEGIWGWRLVDGNGEIVASGEGYVTKSNAERGARNVIQTVLDIVDAEGEVEIHEGPTR